MKISIIIPTLGRKEQVAQLLSSLTAVKNFRHEIIIVDQNFNNTLDEIVDKYSTSYNVIHYKVDFRGLSKAKNFGIEIARGKYICFPDDDSKFLEDTIYNAFNILDNDSKIDIVFGRCIDEDGVDSVIKFSKNEAELSLNNFNGKFIEATMFAKTDILKKNKFDENMGIGTFFGAEEGYDLIYRLLNQKLKLYYSPRIKFYHPQTLTDYSNFNSLKRVFEYRKGFSYLCLKHKLYKKLIKRVLLVFFSIPIFFIIDGKKARYYTVEFLSLIIGIIFSNQKRR